MEEWKQYYIKQAREKEEARKAKKVADLLGSKDLQAETERAHKDASLEFFRISDLVEEVETGKTLGTGVG